MSRKVMVEDIDTELFMQRKRSKEEVADYDAGFKPVRKVVLRKTARVMHGSGMGRGTGVGFEFELAFNGHLLNIGSRRGESVRLLWPASITLILR